MSALPLPAQELLAHPNSAHLIFAKGPNLPEHLACLARVDGIHQFDTLTIPTISSRAGIFEIAGTVFLPLVMLQFEQGDLRHYTACWIDPYHPRYGTKFLDRLATQDTMPMIVYNEALAVQGEVEHRNFFSPVAYQILLKQRRFPLWNSDQFTAHVQSFLQGIPHIQDLWHRLLPTAMLNQKH